MEVHDEEYSPPQIGEMDCIDGSDEQDEKEPADQTGKTPAKAPEPARALPRGYLVLMGDNLIMRIPL